MDVRKLAWQALVIVGLVAVLLGAVDPLEGSVLIVIGSGLVTLAALLGKSPQRKLLTAASILVGTANAKRGEGTVCDRVAVTFE